MPIGEFIEFQLVTVRAINLKIQRFFLRKLDELDESQLYSEIGAICL